MPLNRSAEIQSLYITVLHDAEHPSRLVLGQLEQEFAPVPLPAYAASPAAPILWRTNY
ncbi:MAG: hypothetical protein ACSHXK_07495 [Oceanococcus sp.]